MSMLRKILIVFLATTLALGLVVPLRAQDAPVEAFPLAGLDGEVTVKYDAFGVPHIYASTEADLFRVQGYVTAQDRWWQMEWSRRQARGELSLIMGANLVGTDTFLRTLGLRQMAERDLAVQDEATLMMLEAYAEGVNAWLATQESPSDAAIEYNFAALLGAKLELEPWTVLDTMMFVNAVALNFSAGYLEYELTLQGIIDAAGALAAAVLYPPYDYANAPLISEPGWKAETSSAPAPDYSQLPAPNLASVKLPKLALPSFPRAGSNSWAVSGALTDTGLPYMANDPHISQNLPSVWYQVGLHCVEVTPDCRLNAYGYIFPGAPGILIGHNANLSWGMTVNGLDLVDIYKLELNPDNPNQYLYEGEYVDMSLRTETIPVAGGEPVEITVRETRFGPVINELVGMEQPMAARFVIAEPKIGTSVIYYVPRAQNWEEFQAAVARFDMAGQNYMYADVEGNIAVIAGGKFPLRVKGHNGTLPVDGTTSAFEWGGFLDPMENPRVFNPEAGYLIAANNAFLRPADFVTTFGYYYDYGQRAGRLETLLQAQATHTIDSMKAIQNDVYHPVWNYMQAALSALSIDDPALAELRDYLVAWDGMNTVESGQALLFNAFWMKLLALTFDELAPLGGVEGGTLEMFTVGRIIENPNHPLWRNASLPEATRDDLLVMALQEAEAYIVEALGADRSAWSWGALHVSVPRHVPFGQLPAGRNIGLDLALNDINRLFNRQYAVPGGTDNVNNQAWSARNGHFTLSGAIVSMRMIVDFSNLDNSQFIMELGQSGDPFSPHYDDMSPLWASGEYLPYGFTPEAVDAITERVVTFAP